MEYPYRKCAAAVLFNDSGRVLVCARNDLQHDDWQFPQGGVEAGETAVDAARRELYEETSVRSVQFVTAMEEGIRYTFPDFILEKRKKRGRAGIPQIRMGNAGRSGQKGRRFQKRRL